MRKAIQCTYYSYAVRTREGLLPQKSCLTVMNLTTHALQEQRTMQELRLPPGLLGWADIIFCMGKKHVRRIKERYSDIIADKTVICLNIPDDYNYMDDDLCELLNAIIPEYL